MRCDPKQFTLSMKLVSPAQRGFSMLEVLISLVIIATALLGTAGLQIYAMRMGQSSQFRIQATFLATDILDRIEANKDNTTGIVAGNYVTSGSGTPQALTYPDPCMTSACTAAQLANRDRNQWENAVATALPQATWSVTITGAGNNIYTAILGWTDRSSIKQNTGETFSYTATRVIGR
jgi:type IV pilus assembly protein PilV